MYTEKNKLFAPVASEKLGSPTRNGEIRTVKSRFQPGDLAWIATMAALMALCLKKPVPLSLATLAVVGAGIWQVVRDRSFAGWHNPLLLAGALLFGLNVVAGLYSPQMGPWLEELQIKLPIVALAFAFAALPAFSPARLKALCLTFLAAHVLTAGLSVGLYFFMDYENMMKTISQNSSIPIITGLNHIYFSVGLSFSVLAGFWALWIARFEWKQAERIFGIAGVVLGFICLHILTSRTGLAAFYGGLLALAGLYLYLKRSWKQGIAIGILLLALPLLAYVASPALRIRLQVSRYDFTESLKPGVNLHNMSIGMRLYTWKLCRDIFLLHPLGGVGPGELGDALIAGYRADGISAPEQQWLRSAHNQYLEQLAGMGIMGLAGLLIWLAAAFGGASTGSSILRKTLLCTLVFAMLAESILERQHGIALAMFWIALLYKSEKEAPTRFTTEKQP